MTYSESQWEKGEGARCFLRLLQQPLQAWFLIGDTHMLVLVPAGLTLRSLGELVKGRYPGSEATGYRYIWDRILNQLSTPNERSYWVLMKKDVIPGSRNQSFETQKEMVENSHAMSSK